ncbi:hypothetical protein ONZ51_g6355 [Trametes cubensis]|uniref:Uncharacterized protein n=1 Tax=Trametes cubensis TaxID=1111947 RepID=A0AAD7XA45_9APHY|nr:hypothetical protein ONZ51_g6355 [Trametes cubensis]
MASDYKTHQALPLHNKFKVEVKYEFVPPPPPEPDKEKQLAWNMSRTMADYGTSHCMDAPFVELVHQRASAASLHSRDFCDLHEECGGGSGGTLDARMDALKGASIPQTHFFGTR